MSSQQSGKGRGRGRGAQQSQQPQQQQQQQQRPAQQQQRPPQQRQQPQAQSQAASAPKIVIPTATPTWTRPQQTSSTTVYAQSNVSASGAASITASIQATQSRLVETPTGQQTITQSTLTASSEDTVSDQMQSISLTHTQQTTTSSTTGATGFFCFISHSFSFSKSF